MFDAFWIGIVGIGGWVLGALTGYLMGRRAWTCAECNRACLGAARYVLRGPHSPRAVWRSPEDYHGPLCSRCARKCQEG